MKTHLLQSVFIVGILLAIAIFITVEKAHAYTYYKIDFGVYECPCKWPGEHIRWRAGNGSFPAGSVRRSALVAACRLWNRAPGQFTFDENPHWGDLAVGLDNEDNEIWFSTNEDILDNAPAIHYPEIEVFPGIDDCSCNRVESDIIFDANVVDVNWSYLDDNRFNRRTALRAYGGDQRPFETTAIHEMGHAVGLEHNNYNYNIMGTDFTHISSNDEAVTYYVGEDAGNGEVFLYGADHDLPFWDIGVVHWKYGGAGGRGNEYSVHVPTQIFTSDGEDVIDSDAFLGDGMLRYHVRAGSEYQVEFTYENNGVDDIDGVPVAYYISTDNWITSLDDRIRTRTLDLDRNTVYTHRHLLTIPARLRVGQTYWIGVIVDYTDRIPERQETNNAAYIPIQIVP